MLVCLCRIENTYKNDMHIHIAKIHGVLWSGEADALIAPASEGQVTILRGHVPFVTKLKGGALTVKKAGEVVFAEEVQGGVLEVTGESTTVLL